MGLIPDVSSIVSSMFESKSDEAKPQNLSTLGSAGTQGAYFRKSIEGFDTNGDGDVPVSEIMAMAGMGNANHGPVSPRQWPVLKFYGKMVQHESAGDVWYYVNRFGIIRKTNHTDPDSTTTGCDSVSEKLTAAHFDLLLENGGQNFKGGNVNEPITVMPFTAQCGMDGKFVKDQGKLTGLIDPYDGNYRKFAAGNEGGPGCVSRADDTTTLDATDLASFNPGTEIDDSFECPFPTHIGERNTTEWDKVISDEQAKASEYTVAIDAHATALNAYDDFMNGDSDGGKRKDKIVAPDIVPELSQYYGKHVTVFGGSAGSLKPNPNGKRYYVTNFGIPREWAPPAGGGRWNSIGSAWQTRPPTCKGTVGQEDMNIVVHISEANLNKLKDAATSIVGYPGHRSMNVNEPCGVSGRFVRVGTSGPTAWVDILGNKHVIDENSPADTCKSTSIQYLGITQDEYNAIPGNITPTTEACGVSGLSASEFTRYIELQSDLIAKGVAVMNLVSELMNDNLPAVQSHIREEQEDLEDSVEDLVREQTQVSTNQRNAINATGRFETGEEQTTYALRMYVVWLIVALLVMAITIHTMVSGENTVFVYGVIGFCALLIVYYMYVRATRG
jgi:hypothetical protein